MIVTKLMGGLGNQIFQYAVGRAVAERHGTRLRLDVSHYAQYAHRRYSLAPFRIEAELASAGEQELVLRSKPFAALPLTQPIPRSFFRSIVQPGLGFDFFPQIFEAGNHLVLNGYWQHLSYVEPVAETLRKEFRLQVPLTPEGEETRRRMEAGASVALHVRRTDYTNLTIPTQFCGLDYYRRALAWIGQRVPDPVYFVFSDDLDWARTHLPLPASAVFVGHNDSSRDYEDMVLMSYCRHHIIANSTFSLWGAWFNQKPGKLVVAPARWIIGDLQPPHLVPVDWTRL